MTAVDRDALDDVSARRVDALIDVFRQAEARMADLPLYRQGLAVEGRGFCLHDGLIVGILVTPWCMNVVLMPGPERGWTPLHPGAEVDHALPCGTVRFVSAQDEGVGDYRMCSLFSPMFEFADMEAVRATADAALADVLAAPAPPAAPPPATPRAMSRRDLFRRRGG